VGRRHDEDPVLVSLAVGCSPPMVSAVMTSSSDVFMVFGQIRMLEDVSCCTLVYIPFLRNKAESTKQFETCSEVANDSN
jgi:hypothetical protein